MNTAGHHRRSIRLKGFDYSHPGICFITICTYHHRHHLFGEIRNGVMQLNAFGSIVADEWMKSAAIRAEIELDEFVVMPNHIHGIVMIMDDCTAPDGKGDRPEPNNCAMPNGRGDLPVAPTPRDDVPSLMPVDPTTRDGVPSMIPVVPTSCVEQAACVALPHGPAPKSFGALVAGFKSAATKRINEIRHAPGAPVWQRNYWEHMVRNEMELNRIRQYIINNPMKWKSDMFCAKSRKHPNTVREPDADYAREVWMI